MISATAKTKTYWNYDVIAHANGNVRPLVTGYGQTLAEAFAAAFKDGCYYIGMGYTVSVRFRENCQECEGEGTRWSKRRKWQRVTCKACKGRGKLQETPEQRLETGESVRIVEVRPQFRRDNHAHRIEVFKGVHGFIIRDMDTGETHGMGDHVDHLQCATGVKVGTDEFYRLLMQEVDRDGATLRKLFFGP